MDDRQREQLRLIVTHEINLVRRALDARITTVFADHARRGRLHSGATIKVSVRAMGEIAAAFLTDLGAKARVVATDANAFDALSDAVRDCLDACAEQMALVTRTANGRNTRSSNQSLERVAGDLFSQMRSDIEAKLAIMGFDFGRPPAITSTPLSSPQPAKKGGRPPADFWDDMWASVAVALFDGGLTPKSQADIERAMADWIEANGHYAADSTIRGRARRLWDRIAALDP